MNARFCIKVIISSLLLLSLIVVQGYASPDTETLRPEGFGTTTNIPSEYPASDTFKFGYDTDETAYYYMKDRITGSVFTLTGGDCHVLRLMIYLRSLNSQSGQHWVGAIYKHSDSTLVKASIVSTIPGFTSGTSEWNSIFFSSPYPKLINNTEYVLVVNTDGVYQRICRHDGDTNQGHYNTTTYPTFPSPIGFSHEDYEYCIYAVCQPYVHWDKVDEETPDTNTYVFNDVVDEYRFDTYETENTSIDPSYTINNVKIYVRCYAALTFSNMMPSYAKTVLRVAGTDYFGSEITLTTGFKDYYKEYLKNPSTDNSWNATELDLIEAGVSLKPAYDPLNDEWGKPKCTQVYVIIDYTISGVEEWHNVVSWNFDLTTRQWLTASTWNFNLSIMQWNDVVAWSFNLTTMAWQNIANWTFNMTTMAWHTVTTWTFNLISKGWNNIAQWTFQTITKTWHNIINWNFDLISLGWHTITYWTITLTQTIRATSYVLLVLFAAIILLPLLFAIKNRKIGKPKYEEE